MQRSTPSDPDVIAYGTTRLLRVRRITDHVYHVENLRSTRGVETPDIVVEHWTVVARTDGPHARGEALDWLTVANKQIREI